MKLLGLYNNTDDVICNSLYSNDVHIMDRAVSLSRQFGIRIDGMSVLLDDSPVAKGIRTSEIHDSNSNVCVDTVKLEHDEDYIPISVPDYNTLLHHNLVSGYLAYVPKNKYTVEDEYLQDNIETEANFSKADCPILSIKYYSGRLKVGDPIIVSYFIDTYRMDSINRNTIHDTFTVIITLDGNDNNVLYKRTHYAGEYKAVISESIPIGTHWLEIKAIDNDGCCSPSSFVDFIIEDVTSENIYDASDGTIFNQYNITIGPGHNPLDEEACEIEAYKNKIGFSRLFKELKDSGYTGIKFPKDSIVRLSYHINEYVKSDRYAPYNMDGKIQLSTIKYYRVKISKSGVDSNGEDIYVYDEVHQLDFPTFYRYCLNKLWTNWNEGDHILLDSNKGSITADAYAIPEFYSYYKTASGLVNKVTDPDTGQTVEVPWSDEEKEAHRVKRVHQTSGMPAVGEIVQKHDEYNAPDTFVDLRDHDDEGYYYMMLTLSVTDLFSTRATVDGDHIYDYTYRPNIEDPYGDFMVIPDSFTIDLNGSILKATDHTMRWSVGQIIYIIDRNNVVIKNGTIQSQFNLFRDANKLTQFWTGRAGIPCLPEYLVYKSPNNYQPKNVSSAYAQGEGITYILGSSNCKFENITFKYALGFDPSVRSRTMGTAKPSFINGDVFDETLSNTPLKHFNKELLTRTDSSAMSITNKVSISSSFTTLVTPEYFLTSFVSSGVGTDRSNRDHYFIICYNNNEKLVKVIKVLDANHIRIPTSIKRIRILIYGIGGDFDDSLYPAGPNCPAPPILTRLNGGSNNIYYRCNFIESRTCVVHPHISNGTIFKDCVFRNIAYAQGTDLDWFAVTPYFGDTEEGHCLINKLLLLNCHNYKSDEAGRFLMANHGSTLIVAENCTGIGFSNTGLTRNLILINTHLPKLQLYYTPDKHNNHFLIRDCVIGERYEEWFSGKGSYQDSTRYTRLLHKPDVEKIITLKNVKINQHIRYNNYNMHNVINGKQRYD